MKNKLIYMAALAMLASACSNEDDPILSGNENNGTGEVKMITETITATNSDANGTTRADVDANAKFTWSKDDKIAVHVSDGKYYTTEALAEGDGGSNNADFSVSYPEGSSRDAFAIFPASIVNATATYYGQESHALAVTLPSSYTLAQVSGTKTPCPMIAINTPGSGWEFKQLCGMLRLTVSNIPADATGLKILFPGKKVNGNFYVASPVTPGTSTISLPYNKPATGEDRITVTGLNGSATTYDINLPLPVGAYDDVYIMPVGGDTKVAAVNHIKAGGYTAARAHARKLTTTLVSSPISVSATKKVIFAPGNLQYLGNADGTGTWRFAEHQYDFMGDGPSSGTNYQGNVTVAGYSKYNASADLDVARDLFGWGTSGYNNKYPYMTSTSNGSYYSGSMVDDGANYDWGVYHSASGSSTDKITNGGNYAWRLWTSEEMSYVMKRTNKVYTRDDYMENKKLFCYTTLSGVTTNDIKGMIIFPDGWTGNFIKTIKYASDSYDNNVFNADQWAMLEGLGCVFLPAAHTRDGVSISYKDEGHYWTSTVFSVLNNTEYRGGCLEFWDGNSSSSATNDRVRKLGQSVRLIRDVE